MNQMPSNDTPRPNPYDQKFNALIESGNTASSAIDAITEMYLDGKPKSRGRIKITPFERDTAFWLSEFVSALPAASWRSDILTLALSRYFAQEQVTNVKLLGFIATVSPVTVCRAVRNSGLVLLQKSPRRNDLERIAGMAPEIVELCRILNIFDLANNEVIEAVERGKVALSKLSPFELLIYASLYAFEHLVPARFEISTKPDGADAKIEETWYAINDLFIWKISTAAEGSLNLTETDIGHSLSKHLLPFLFSLSTGPDPRDDLREAFRILVDAQVELNSFVSQSADAFSYDDSIQFVRCGNRLEIVEIGADAREAWHRDAMKLKRLHRYWYHRALDKFLSSDKATHQIGQKENQEANRFAYLRAMRTHLQLTEVYGVAEKVATASGEQISLFQALLSLELMSVFFQQDFLQPFARHLKESGHWATALGQLALDGLKEDYQNRFPLTWSDRTDKITRITGWTVSTELPQGSPRIAAAILDFWSNDWVSLSARLRKGEPGLHPELLERPILKFGHFLVQLPWIVGFQNNSTAAINNLRRLGARRDEARGETRRIEERLGKIFEARGFRVALNWHPPAENFQDAGEVDLICARDEYVFVFEIKSTFLRRLQSDAWRHETTTLRKAGQQLRRKTAAVRRELNEKNVLASMLSVNGSAETLKILGWIIDTSIECDHQLFNGFLKVSLEEVLIALWDDRHFLNDPDGLFSGRYRGVHSKGKKKRPQETTLYPGGFTAARFVEVIENESVWDEK